jgi:hypothetical protein
MKSLHGFLLVLGLVAILAVPGFAVDTRGPIHVPAPPSPRDCYSCDEDWLDNGLYQSNQMVYGNAFDVGAGGPLSLIEFYHYSWYELVGPYEYYVVVYDEGTCSRICEIGPFSAADAYDHHEMEVEDLCASGCVVTDRVVVGIRPMSISTLGWYHPTVDIDETGFNDECDRRVDYATGAGCDIPDVTGDFVLRICVDECGPTAAEPTSWGRMKSLYR